MKNPRKLFVAAYAKTLLVDVYRFIATLPASEKFNLVSQMQRSASSIDDNITEGCSRQGDRAMLPFLYHAHSSAGELAGQFRKSRLLLVGDQLLAKSTGRRAGRMQIMLARLIKEVEACIDEERAARRKQPRRRRSSRRTK